MARRSAPEVPKGWALPQASIPIRQGGRAAKNASTLPLASFLRSTGRPAHLHRDTDLALRGHERGTDLIGPELGQGPVAVPLDDPALVGAPLERAPRQAQLLDGVEAADPQQVLLPQPREPLGAAMALWRAHERRRALEAEEAPLGLASVADVLAAVVMAELQAVGDALGEATKVRPHGLPGRLERREAIGAAAGPLPAAAGSPFGSGSSALRALGQEAVLAPQPQDTAAGTEAGEAQPRPSVR